MHQPPDHRPDPVEKLKGFLAPRTVDRPCRNQNPKVNVGLFGRTVCDPVMIQSSPADPSVALSQIGRHRRGRPNDLIRKALEFRRHPVYERDGCPGRPECDIKSFKVVVGSDGVDVLRGVHTPTRTAGDNRCQGSRSDRPEAGLPLTTVGPPVIRHSSHEHHEEHHRPSPMTPISRSRSGWPGRGAASDGRGRIQQQVAASASDCSGRDRPRTRSTVNGPGRRSTDDGRRPRFRTTAPVNGQRPWSWSTVDGPWISSRPSGAH